MNERIDGRRAASEITKALSLRAPQRESLDILAELLERLKLSKDADLRHWLKTIRARYPTVEKFERDFPTLCFALATGVGKTRLMGAIIAWLFITGRSRHFFVLAPNLTIYEKLKQDFLPGSPKYVFKGIPELANNPPVLITGEDYEDGRGVRLDIAVPQNVTGELFTDDTAPHINIFNISKINARDNKKGAARSSVARAGQSHLHVMKPSNSARNVSEVAASIRLVLMLPLRDVLRRSRFITIWRTMARLLAAYPVRTVDWSSPNWTSRHQWSRFSTSQ